ncbi:uncharacterized protein SCODWIG_03576 [Saccharomycodes ludwigii]|uniref:C2H2-type domain-containing protein n=1 Tax=Saccharomycodes ludwigii TaxID=36035 RepID=A0A376BAV7_9ASCO|nr:hypothetical protein SCDLUD_000801 [Saccharomycodes ludwigii]KAH3903184.1 hypothetical protein SCDLUD_000801 [Saccharomycodes ludwigii]SSD61815.1 uncharacterized protein SCODWIG_03576 [Saccharomycodes ludwigii]
MGYIHFDRVYVPQRNSVPLGLINKQFAKQKEQEQLKSGGVKQTKESTNTLETSTNSVNSDDSEKLDYLFDDFLKGVETVLNEKEGETSAASSLYNGNKTTGNTVDDNVFKNEFFQLEEFQLNNQVLLDILGKNVSTRVTGNNNNTELESLLSNPMFSLDEEMTWCDSLQQHHQQQQQQKKANVDTIANSIKSMETFVFNNHMDNTIPFPVFETKECERNDTVCDSFNLANSFSSNSNCTSPTSIESAIDLVALPTSASSNSNGNPFQCPHCVSNFKEKAYLTRHLKKHNPIKDYRCPYWTEDHQCHPTGDFSRKDTFRAHMKSVHFIYPSWLKKTEKDSSVGRCSGCFEKFENNKNWLVNHIEPGKCGAMIRKEIGSGRKLRKKAELYRKLKSGFYKKKYKKNRGSNDKLLGN